MPFYVVDPKNPGKIDVIELQLRNPEKVLTPVLVNHWVKKDLWTRRQALQLLAGCVPSQNAQDMSITEPREYLDGTSDMRLHHYHWEPAPGADENGRIERTHPLRETLTKNLITLKGWMEHSDLNETKSPQDWLAWAKEKGFKPYWLEYVEAIQSAPTPKVEAETDTPQVNTPQDNAAHMGEALAMVGHGLLFMEVAKLEALKALQNNLSANQLFKRYVSLKGKSDGKCEPMPPPHIADAKPTPTPKVNAVHDEVKRAVNKAADNPPGKMPRTAIGKLAIKAAWEIEHETKQRATVNEVIAKLQAWVNKEDALYNVIKNGVSWQTTGLKVKDFDIDACSKALKTWHSSRA